MFELDETFGPEHVIFDSRVLSERVTNTLTAQLNLSSRAQHDARVIIEDELQPRGRLSDASWAKLVMCELPQRFRAAELGPDLKLVAPASILEHIDTSFTRGLSFDDVMRRCDDTESVSDYLEALQRGREIVMGVFRVGASE